MIYTKKGDLGETGLIDGTRVPKSGALIEAIGAVDELNAVLGAVETQNAKVKSAIRKIQNDLFWIGSRLAGYEAGLVLDGRVRDMEKEIDRLWAKMPPLKNFIVPRGQLHLARAVCRRAERAVARANPKFPLKYLNRLSDYLFALARWVNFKKGVREVVWKSGQR